MIEFVMFTVGVMIGRGLVDVAAYALRRHRSASNKIVSQTHPATPER